jgi:hypothetical protein
MHVQSLPTVPLLNGFLKYFLRISAQVLQFLAQYLNVPPRAARISACLVRITFMLIFKMKAKPMHLFKKLEELTVFGDRLLTPYAH